MFWAVRTYDVTLWIALLLVESTVVYSPHFASIASFIVKVQGNIFWTLIRILVFTLVSSMDSQDWTFIIPLFFINLPKFEEPLIWLTKPIPHSPISRCRILLVITSERIFPAFIDLQSISTISIRWHLVFKWVENIWQVLLVNFILRRRRDVVLRKWVMRVIFIYLLHISIDVLSLPRYNGGERNLVIFLILFEVFE